MADETLYLLPGLLCAPFVWKFQQRDLADDADIRIADFWGFDSLTEMAKDVLAKAPARFAVAGHSMGARVALEVIRLAPERVTRIALLDTGTHMPRPGEVEKRHELVELARAKGMSALAAAWLPPMVHPGKLQDTAFMRTLMDMVCKATPEIFAGQVKALLNRPPAVPVLSTICCPLLVACGRQDVWSPVTQHEEIISHIPGATLTVFEDSGHMSIMETPEPVSSAMRKWLQETI